MKKGIAALLLSTLLISAGMAWAEAPILVSHTLTDCDLGYDSVVLHYNLTVKNPGDNSLSNVTLTHVPLLIISSDDLTLNVGKLDPHAEIQITFSLVTPIHLNLSQSEVSAQPLFWAGECRDGNGSLIEFPARSVEGGAL